MQASDPAPRTLQQFIGGRFVPPADGDYVDDVAPSTGDVVARLPRGAGTDVDAAARAARAALAAGWGTTSVAARAACLEAVADGLAARADELAHLEALDTGKPLRLAQSVDIPRAIANFRFFAGAVRHDETAFHAMDGAFNYTLRRPLGVVGLITPWNLPLYLLTWKAAPALAMGNAVVAKPSELTPLTAQALAEIVAAAGAPPGVFNLVHGLGSEAGQTLVEHADVAAVSFTGGTATGARVAATAAPQFKKLSLELGGKNPTLVFADADFTVLQLIDVFRFLRRAAGGFVGSRSDDFSHDACILRLQPLQHYAIAEVDGAEVLRPAVASGDYGEMGVFAATARNLGQQHHSFGFAIAVEVDLQPWRRMQPDDGARGALGDVRRTLMASVLQRDRLIVDAAIGEVAEFGVCGRGRSGGGR